jgi:hypothetical protein
VSQSGPLGDGRFRLTPRQGRPERPACPGRHRELSGTIAQRGERLERRRLDAACLPGAGQGLVDRRRGHRIGGAGSAPGRSRAARPADRAAGAMKVVPQPSGFASADKLVADGAPSVVELLIRGPVDQYDMAAEHLRRRSWTLERRFFLRRYVNHQERTRRDEQALKSRRAREWTPPASGPHRRCPAGRPCRSQRWAMNRRTRGESVPSHRDVELAVRRWGAEEHRPPREVARRRLRRLRPDRNARRIGPACPIRRRLQRPAADGRHGRTLGHHLEPAPRPTARNDGPRAHRRVAINRRSRDVSVDERAHDEPVSPPHSISPN